jgi:hypothetical protein
MPHHTTHPTLYRGLAAAVLTLAATALLTPPAAAGGGDASTGTDTGPSTGITGGAHPYHLTITVAHTGDPELDGTHELYCQPSAGTHPDAAEACAAIELAEEPFAPVAENALCTFVYGGPATAQIEGTWAGEPVSATYSRENGCEVARWDRLVPALPRVGEQATGPA